MPTCPECGSAMRLRNSKYGLFYACTRYPECQATHGADPDGKPLGTTANAETKQWRIKAHAAFDRLYEGGTMSKGAAYRWLQARLDLPPDKCHIAMFDTETCQRVIAACEAFDPAMAPLDAGAADAMQKDAASRKKKAKRYWQNKAKAAKRRRRRKRKAT